jgi:hypothetical protein
MTEDDIREVAILAAGNSGHTWESIPPGSRVRWIAEVAAAVNGGQDETTVGQACRQALREYQQPKPEPAVAPEAAKPKALIKKK